MPNFALSFIYGFIFFSLSFYDLFPLKRIREKLVSRRVLFIMFSLSIFSQFYCVLVDLTNACACVISNIFMDIGIRLHVNYISLFCHSNPFRRRNVHELHMFNCYQHLKKKEPKNTCRCCRIGSCRWREKRAYRQQ